MHCNEFRKVYQCVIPSSSAECLPPGPVPPTSPAADIDECLTGSHTCAHKCANSEGSYSCSCFDGYTTDDNGGYCYGKMYGGRGREGREGWRGRERDGKGRRRERRRVEGEREGKGRRERGR